MNVVPGSGTYHFAGTFDCLLQSGTAYDAETFSVNSGGHYDNTVCGTGNAYNNTRSALTNTLTDGSKGGTIDAATITTGFLNTPAGPVTVPGTTDLRNTWWGGSATHTPANQLDLSYYIRFTGGQGALTFTDKAGSIVAAENGVILPPTAEVTGGGSISIIATGPGPPFTSTSGWYRLLHPPTSRWRARFEGVTPAVS